LSYPRYLKDDLLGLLPFNCERKVLYFILLFKEASLQELYILPVLIFITLLPLAFIILFNLSSDSFHILLLDLDIC